MKPSDKASDDEQTRASEIEIYRRTDVGSNCDNDPNCMAGTVPAYLFTPTKHNLPNAQWGWTQLLKSTRAGTRNPPIAVPVSGPLCTNP